MKDRIWNYIFGVLLIIFGIMFIISAESAFSTIVLVAGIIIIIFSVLKMVVVLKSDSMLASFSVPSSIIGIIFGIILIGNSDKAIDVLTLVLGLWFLISGISSLIILIKANVDSRELSRPILKIIVGTIAFIAPVIPVVAVGLVIGIVLIIAGVTTFINSKEEEVVYKVKVKK